MDECIYRLSEQTVLDFSVWQYYHGSRRVQEERCDDQDFDAVLDLAGRVQKLVRLRSDNDHSVVNTLQDNLVALKSDLFDLLADFRSCDFRLLEGDVFC